MHQKHQHIHIDFIQYSQQFVILAQIWQMHPKFPANGRYSKSNSRRPTNFSKYFKDAKNYTPPLGEWMTLQQTEWTCMNRYIISTAKTKLLWGFKEKNSSYQALRIRLPSISQSFGLSNEKCQRAFQYRLFENFREICQRLIRKTLQSIFCCSENGKSQLFLRRIQEENSYLRMIKLILILSSICLPFILPFAIHVQFLIKVPKYAYQAFIRILVKSKNSLGKIFFVKWSNNKFFLNDYPQHIIVHLHLYSESRLILITHQIKLLMSNIRDLQKLRVTKNQSVFAQTNYPNNQNPENRKSYFESYQERTPILTTRSPKKYNKDTEDSSKSPSKVAPHRRGGSFGLNFNEQKTSVIFQNPRVSIYNISMKLTDPRRKESMPLQYPMSQRKERESFFQVNEIAFSRKKSTMATSSSPIKNPQVSKKMFNVLYPIGKGGFGKVWKVQHKKTRQIFAMKQMSKVKVINKKSVTSVMNQKQFLTKLSHPFLVNMSSAFQDREHLYLIMDYLDGGDLRYHLGNKRCFNEKETKFFVANIIIGLQFLHKNKIIHRDIKPENLVLDSQGYLRITDLGISREFKQNNSNDTSGTPGYMAPQVMNRKDHSFGVDCFALGVIAYEFMLGRRPYLGKDRKEIKENMLAKQAQVRIDELPYKWSPNAIDFINRLLQRNPQARLGSSGIEEIIEHPWLTDVEWQRIFHKKLKAPFKPISIEEDYQSYKQQISEDTIVENQEETMLMLRDEETQSLFEGYFFQRKEEKPSITSFSTNYTEQNYRRR